MLQGLFLGTRLFHPLREALAKFLTLWCSPSDSVPLVGVAELFLLLWTSVGVVTMSRIFGRSTSKEDVDTGSNLKVDPFDTKEFFKAVATDWDDALEAIRQAGPSQDSPPTQQAEKYIRSGEWDHVEPVTIRELEVGVCTGVVGVGGIVDRFCGRMECTVAGHKTKQFDGYKPGWYIPGGTHQRSGYHCHPTLPPTGSDGPIPFEAKAVLESDTRATLLSVGQWKLVMESFGSADDEAQSLVSEDEVVVMADGGTTSPPRMSEGTATLAALTQRATEMFKKQVQSPAPTTKKKTAKSAPPKTNLRQPPLQAELLTQLQESMQLVLKEVGTLRSSLATLQNRVGHLESENQGLLETVTSCELAYQELQQENTTLKDYIEETAKNIESQLNATANPTHVAGIGRKVHQLEQSITSMQSQVVTEATLDRTLKITRADFSVQLKNLRNRLDVGNGVHFKHFHFPNPKALQDWMTVHGQPSYGLFMDAFSMIHSMDPEVVSKDKSLRAMKAQADVNINGDLETGVVTSFRNTVPFGFFDADSDSTSNRLETVLKSPSCWKTGPGITSVAKRLRTGTRDVKSRLMSTIEVECTDNDARLLAQEMSAESAQFVEDLINFGKDYHAQLMDYENFTEQTAWDVVVKCIVSIMQDLSKSRSRYRDLGGSTNGPARAAALIFGELSAIKVQQEYQRHGFSCHPSLTGLMIRPALEMHPANDNEKRIKKLETASAGAASVKGDIAALKQRVRVLEEKK